MSDPILAWEPRATNADLIADCATLGYLPRPIVDLTYGLGTFWNVYRPRGLVGCDLDPDKSPIGHAVDFTDTGFDDGEFASAVLDPPYKLNGTPDPIVDARYGVDQYVGIEGRHQLIRDGLTEAARIVRAGGYVLLKCQDQVSSGKVQWQTVEFINHAAGVSLVLEDMLFFPSYRAQPSGTRQLHARRNYSTMLVLRA